MAERGGSSKMSFDSCLPVILKFEGGYSCDPSDRGGATCHGITQKAYDSFRWPLPSAPVRGISDDDVADIYRLEYWDKVQGNSLPSPVDLVVFDSAVNVGVKRASRWLQAAVKVSPDGVIGKQTLMAVQSLDPVQVAEAVLDMRQDFYNDFVEFDPSQSRFLRGWLNRVADLRKGLRNG